MRGCADEEEYSDALMTNDVMTPDSYRDDQNGYADQKAAALCDSLPWEGREGYSEAGIMFEERPDEDRLTAQVIKSPLMANNVMTSDTYWDDQNGADEGSTDGKGFTEKPLQENKGTEVAGTNTTPRAAAKAKAKRARERSAYRTLREKSYAAVGNELTGCAPPPSKLVDNIQTVMPRVKLDPSWDRKTSTIDELLTPEIMDQILRKMRNENSIRGKGMDDFSQPNTLMDIEVDDGS